jgi:Protein of unknown function (DUF1552)
MSARQSRRLFLCGAGVSMALPFLPSALWSRRAGAATPAAPRRFLSWFLPNGLVMTDFTPATTGTAWATTKITAPLMPVKNKIAILTGFDHSVVGQPTPPLSSNPPGGHGGGTGCFLNMLPVDGYQTSNLRTSIDQMLLPVLNAGTPPPFASLQIGLQGDNGLCDRVSCDFSRALSWKAGAALPNIYDPQQLFDKIFANVSSAPPTPASTAAAAARAAEHKSILDAVLGEATSLSAKLAPADKIKLDQYMTAIRDLETQIQNQASAKPVMCTVPTRPASPGVLNFNRGITPSTILTTDMPLFNQMMALAFQCDLTRSITFMLGNGTSNNDYQFLIGSSTPHHGTSHHMGNVAQLAKLTQIDVWEFQQAAALLTALDAQVEPDGTTILDNTTFYMSSDIGDGNTHNHWDMPIVLAGGASGKLKTGGQHLNYGTAVTLPRTVLVGGRNPMYPTARVHASILAAHGINVTSLGTVTGLTTLPEILV